MQASSWLHYLVPVEDPDFQSERERLSATGLRAIAWVCIGATALSNVLTLLLVHHLKAGIFAAADLAMVVMGLVALALSYGKPVRPYTLFLGMLVGYLVCVVNFAAILHPSHEIYFPGQAMAHVPTIVVIVLLVGLASLPVKPLQMLALGISICATLLVMTYAMGRWAELSGYSGAHLTTLVVMVVVCAGLTAVVYYRRAEAFRARRLAEQAFDELRQAQAKLLVSENLASQRRLAAALSHDLNTPLGALTSAFDTIRQLYARKGSDSEQADRLDAVFEEAARSGRQSSERLRDAMEKMRRLTALDRAEELVVDLNELWSDTATVVEAELNDDVALHLDLKPLPRIRCRPQQLSAVFSNLLRNAAAAITDHGRIEVNGERREQEAVFRVVDNGRGIPTERLSHLFEPAFAVRGGTIATTNWGLFVSRGIIAEHGGRLEIQSREGEGTTATVSLPLSLR